MLRTFGHPVIAYGPEGEGNGGGAATTATTTPAVTTPADATTTTPPDATPAQKVWYDDISEEPVRELMKAKGYKSPAEAAMAYHNLNKLVSGTNGGAEAIAVYPGDNATPEQLNAFYAKLGRPEKPDGYTIPAPEGGEADANLVTFAQGAFHEAGLSPKQAETLGKAWNKYVGERAAADAQQFAASNAAELDTYKAQFEAKGGNFDEATAAGKRVVQSLGLDPQTLTKIEGSIGAAAMMELFSKLGLKGGEGVFTAGGQGGNGQGAVENMTPQAATAEINRLNGDADFQKKYTDRNHPEHKASLEKMEALWRRAG